MKQEFESQNKQIQASAPRMSSSKALEDNRVHKFGSEPVQGVFINRAKGPALSNSDIQQAINKQGKKLTNAMIAVIWHRAKLKRNYRLLNTIMGLRRGKIPAVVPSKDVYGDSRALGYARYKLRKKGVPFAVWKRGREAQHLIPAAVCNFFRIQKDWVNSAINGMMLPSGRKATNHLRNKKYDKGKLFHIHGGGAHPNYNKAVKAEALRRGWKPGKVTYPQFVSLCLTMRKLNRPKRKGPASGFVDRIKIKKLKKKYGLGKKKKTH